MFDCNDSSGYNAEIDQPADRFLADFRLQDGGSVYILYPESEEARQWCDEHLSPDAQRWSHGYVIEPRYLDNIAQGIRAWGLELTWTW